MTKQLYFFINILIFIALAGTLNILEFGRFGNLTAGVIGGIAFAILSFLVEPILVFLKLPTNFTGLTLMSLIVNFALFLGLSAGILPEIAIIQTGTFGFELNPLLFRITLNSELLVAALLAVFATALQLLTRKLAE